MATGAAPAPAEGHVRVSLPASSLSQSALLSGMPLLYHQSSLSTLLLATSRSSEGFSFSVPTQLLLPDGGIALGLPPSSLLPSPAGTSESNTPSEEDRVNRLRQGPVSVFASESPEKKVRSQRSRLLLLLATLLTLELLSIFAVLQGKDEYPIFPEGLRMRLHVFGDVRASPFRYSFYIVLLVFCLFLPVAVAGAVIFNRRQMCAIAERDANPLGGGTAQAFPSVLPSVVISACVVVLTGICIFAGLFVLETYLDLLVVALSLMLRVVLNRLNYLCLAPHIFLVKANNSMP
ncbi:putative transmembrane protein [Toxoplasma gondii RUB]|uniref:Transmembrane protein n=11 Tax=Toxoplasma gondii TaxID=5811 RepID=A0A125YFM2_TOXGG|nr:hypothetical protein TGGT1_213570 [Toxoplasma gondii GT1]ESS30779.1 putative transmembrane protein [Toxoplasma gondii VEG]KAF4643721.1 hypothetical protein TGRH88_024760 [Toxoplasma gondii]KFG40272.1 putative transmembrane protein [Toxoplasma gondii GAB2-2007-GAL-DOM2]KFG44382.1 putative transmembrane protein [Toxoplasma gondii p89]KFG54917.1 putative transmembrane protein [Toxoplasma gondii FOU]KFG63127.1 putative transmembrane protein [Toxoplasma gondii RUB]KFH08592.1 putative transmemb